ncbi:MAG: hypothetical protein ABI369_06415 [Acetobacteraceae bacterium]
MPLITRRRALQAAGFAAATFGSSIGARAARPIKIGIMTDMSSVYAEATGGTSSNS